MSVDQFLLSADTTDLNYPDVRPTLDFNFARTKVLDPRITFTRSSGGSYVGADGLIKYAGVNEPRFDHDPSTGESLGLLIEESRTNLFLRSEEFNISPWILDGATISSNVISSPFGDITADKIIEESYTFNKEIFQIITLTSGVSYTISVFAKSSERYLFRFGIDTTTMGQFTAVYFDLLKGEISSISGGINSATITKYPDGWYRCTATFTPVATRSSGIYITLAQSETITRHLGDGTSGIYIWGAQLEVGSFPTSYIPTQGSTRTRARDTASIVGQNFSDFYNQIDSALFFSGRTIATPNVARIFGGVVDTSKGFVSSLYFIVGSSPVVVAWDPLTSGNLGAYVSNTLVKGILTYTSSQPTASFCRDGGAVVSNFNRSFSFGGSTQFGFPNTMNRLVIGSSPWGFDSVLNGTINRLTYWPKRLPNEQLQALTR